MRATRYRTTRRMCCQFIAVGHYKGLGDQTICSALQDQTTAEENHEECLWSNFPAFAPLSCCLESQIMGSDASPAQFVYTSPHLRKNMVKRYAVCGHCPLDYCLRGVLGHPRSQTVRIL